MDYGIDQVFDLDARLIGDDATCAVLENRRICSTIAVSFALFLELIHHNAPLAKDCAPHFLSD